VVTIRTDVSHVKKLSALGGGRQLATGCVVLSDDVRSANGDLPSPDQAVTDDFSSAYTTLEAGAETCYSAGEAGRRAIRSIATMNLGISELEEAAGVLAHLERYP